MYDVIVIGLGGVGSFALRSLAKELKGQGKKILGIERFERGHTKGSSHGESRLFRKVSASEELIWPVGFLLIMLYTMLLMLYCTSYYVRILKMYRLLITV